MRMAADEEDEKIEGMNTVNRGYISSFTFHGTFYNFAHSLDQLPVYNTYKYTGTHLQGTIQPRAVLPR